MIPTRQQKVEQALRELLATIDLHTDCMSNEIDRSALEKWIDAAELALGEKAPEPSSVPMAIVWYHPKDAALFLRSELDETGAADGCVVKLDVMHESHDGGPYLRQAWFFAGIGSFVCSASATVLSNVKAWAYDDPETY